MKKIIKYFSVVLLIFTSVPNLVLAVGANTDVVLPVDVTTQPTSTNQRTTVPADPVAARQTRIDAYKQRVVNKISQTEERRIAGVCKGAQTVVEKMQTHLTSVRDNRKQKYSNVTDKLNNLVTKLKLASIDTTELEAAIATLNDKITVLISSVDNYQTTLADITTIDCVADPSGFKAALTAARQERTDLVISSRSIKSFVSGTIKPLLATIRDGFANINRGATP